MNKLSKEKKNHVILVALAALIVTAAWFFGLLAWQQDHHKRALRDLDQRQSQFITMTNAIARAGNLEVEVAEAASALGQLEAQMATGDIYSWAVNTLREFRQGYKVEMPQVAQPVIGENQLLPGFPYRQASIAVSGSAYFYDFGMFIADFENRHPFARIINLETKPAGSLGGEAQDPERLTFTMEIVFLVKPSAS